MPSITATIKPYPQPDIIQVDLPILMCHGYAGGVSALISHAPLHEPCMLFRSRGAKAFAPNIVPYASIETRSEEWMNRIHALQQQYGFEKFHVIAHSMGGLDMRYAIAKMDAASSVATLTTIASPHQGTTMAELVLKTPGPLRGPMKQFFDWMGAQMYAEAKSDSLAAVEQLTRAYVQEEFNPNVPDHPDVAYYSYSAATGKGTSEPLNPIFGIQNGMIYDQEGPNDGFVSVESAKWGRHHGTMPIGHIEQTMIQVAGGRKKIVDQVWIDVLQDISQY